MSRPFRRVTTTSSCASGTPGTVCSCRSGLSARQHVDLPVLVREPHRRHPLVSVRASADPDHVGLPEALLGLLRELLRRGLHVHRELDLPEDLALEDERRHVGARLVQHRVVDPVDLDGEVHRAPHPADLRPPPVQRAAGRPDQPDLLRDEAGGHLPGAEDDEGQRGPGLTDEVDAVRSRLLIRVPDALVDDGRRDQLTDGHRRAMIADEPDGPRPRPCGRARGEVPRAPAARASRPPTPTSARASPRPTARRPPRRTPGPRRYCSRFMSTPSSRSNTGSPCSPSRYRFIASSILG